MEDDQTQRRDDDKTSTASVRGVAEGPDERSDETTPVPLVPPVRNHGETFANYSARLDVWYNEQKKNNKPKQREGEETDNYLERLEEFIISISKLKGTALLEQKDLEIEQKDLEIEQKDLEIKQKDVEIITYMEESSVKELLELHQGFPEMRHNTKADPSIDDKKAGGKWAIEEVDEGEQPSKQNKPQHYPAKIKALQPAKISSYFDKLKLNFECRRGDGMKSLVKSTLTGHLHEVYGEPRRKLSNFNEASVSLHVVNCLKDVLNCMGLDAEVAQEMSFFACRPDIVVLKYMDLLVLVVEVKNEGKDGMIVTRSESAAGQMFDYTFIPRQLGIDVPIVCLSTYSKMCIGSSEPSIQDLVNEALKRLNAVDADNPFRCKPAEEDKLKKSPGKMGNAVDVIPFDGEAQPTSDMENVVKTQNQNAVVFDRVMYFSEVFKLGNMFQALTVAAACGCIAAERALKAREGISADSAHEIPKEREILKEKWYNVVQSDSYRWTKVKKIAATYALKTTWPKTTKVYMRSVLGMGRTGKVYLCMDSCGRHFAVKMLLMDSAVMEEFDPQRRMDAREVKMKNLIGILKREADTWKKVYREYKDSIWRSTLNGMPCLAMPYVASIPMSRRDELLPKIKDEMKRLAQLGYFYQHSEARWRHIGLRKDKNGNEKIVFIDMESLEKMHGMTETMQNEEVDSFIRRLAERK